MAEGPQLRFSSEIFRPLESSPYMLNVMCVLCTKSLITPSPTTNVSLFDQLDPMRLLKIAGGGSRTTSIFLGADKAHQGRQHGEASEACILGRSPLDNPPFHTYTNTMAQVGSPGVLRRSEGVERMIEEQLDKELGDAQVTTIDQPFAVLWLSTTVSPSSFLRRLVVWSQRISDLEARRERVLPSPHWRICSPRRRGDR